MKKYYPKIHKACAIDVLRPVLEHVFVSKEMIKASDTHVLIHHKTEEVFNKEFVESLPDKPILIHRIHFAEMTRCNCLHHKRYEDKYMIKYYYRELWHYVPFIMEGSIGESTKHFLNYPDTNKVFPKKEDKADIGQIGIKPYLLSKVAEALDFEQGSVRCEFHGEMKAIVVERLHGNYPGVKALIMPVMISK